MSQPHCANHVIMTEDVKQILHEVNEIKLVVTDLNARFDEREKKSMASSKIVGTVIASIITATVLGIFVFVATILKDGF